MAITISLMSKRIWITGGSGFVGINLAQELVRQGHDVSLVLRPAARLWRVQQLLPKVTVQKLDLNDSATVRAALKSNTPQWLFHLAAYAAYPNQTDFDQTIQTNFVASAHLLDAAMEVGVDAFIYAGSSSEYGLLTNPAREIDKPNPNSRYAVTKVASTLYCEYVGRDLGFPVVTLRLFSVYGPYEEPTRLIPTLLLRASCGQWPPLVSPEIKRDFIHVDDVVRAFILAAQTANCHKGSVFNIGTGVETSISDIVHIVKNHFQVQAEPIYGSMPNRQWDIKRWVADTSASQAQLKWHARIPLQEGIMNTWDWLESNPTMRGHYQAAQVESAGV